MPIQIHGKNYVMVNERIQEFRAKHKDGSIMTQIVSNTGDVGNRTCVFKAEIFIGRDMVATGHAQENENDSQINRTSYIENCETSAVGRALGIFGLGVLESVATAEEVAHAIIKQENKPLTPKEEKNPAVDAGMEVINKMKAIIKAKLPTATDEEIWLIICEEAQFKDDKGQMKIPADAAAFSKRDKWVNRTYGKIKEKYATEIKEEDIPEDLSL